MERFSSIADNSVNCGPVLNWLQMDNKGHRLLVPSEESRSINTPAVAAAYSVRRYVSQVKRHFLIYNFFVYYFSNVFIIGTRRIELRSW